VNLSSYDLENMREKEGLTLVQKIIVIVIIIVIVPALASVLITAQVGKDDVIFCDEKFNVLEN
jgi:competence protein ComGC